MERRLQLVINAVVSWAYILGFRFSETKSVAPVGVIYSSVDCKFPFEKTPIFIIIVV